MPLLLAFLPCSSTLVSSPAPAAYASVLRLLSQLNVDEQGVRAWANRRAGGKPIASFRDSTLRSGAFVLRLLRAVAPECVDEALVAPGADGDWTRLWPTTLPGGAPLHLFVGTWNVNGKFDSKTCSDDDLSAWLAAPHAEGAGGAGASPSAAAAGTSGGMGSRSAGSPNL